MNPGTPDECVFPFNYNGVDYYTCTKEGSNQYWCGTTYEYVDYVDCVGKLHIITTDSNSNRLTATFVFTLSMYLPDACVKSGLEF